MAREQHEPLTMEEAEDFIGRAQWRSAKSVEDVAPHQYVVQKRGQRRDDFTEEEFWRFNALIKAEGRWEIWTPPEGFYDSGNRRPQKLRYLYVGKYAYWFTMPFGAVPMLNREHVSVQEQNPTRTVLDESGSQRASENNMSETVWVLDPTKSRPPGKLRHHTSPDCPALRMYTAEAIKRADAESRGYTHCRRNGPCSSATKAGPRPSRNRKTATAANGVSAVDELARVFRDAGLIPPPVPGELARELREQQPWVFTTRQIDPLAMYMFGPYVAEVVAGPIDDYVGISHAGHGVNSYGINYHLVYGPLAVFAQTLWGGVYQDRAQSSAAVCEQLEKVAELLSVAEQHRDSLPLAPARLIVAESDFHGLGICSWLDEPVGDEDAAFRWMKDHQRGTPPPPFPALEAALDLVKEMSS